ncbi:hypothetical protein DPX16_6876 [Anabarilius grahami]|uniref:Uncharacterized protein n=1 Tax=Anabarilius grahami TaxID=495550 RepID=A0A3N0Y6T0_ANAGA|nr:hypothetical protein DPX16_6876 [Anabarilius grahami]
MEQNILVGLRLLVSRDHLSWNSTLISQVNIPERCQNGSDFDSAQRTCAHLSGSEFKGAIRKKMNFISCHTDGKHESERLDEDENLTVHQPQINQTTEISELQPEHNHLVSKISNSVRCDVLDGGNSASPRLTD